MNDKSTQTVLVIDDNSITRKLMRVALQSEGYAVLEAGNAPAALEQMALGPGLVLLDLVLPDIDGLDLARRLRATPAGRDVPILAVSGMLARLEQARDPASGFTDTLYKPVEPSRLLATVRTYLPAAAAPTKQLAQPRKVLVVDDDAIERRLICVQLELLGASVQAAADGVEALDLARGSHPDLIISDVLMPRMDGFALCRAVCDDPSLRNTQVVLVSSNFVEEEDRELALSVGARDFLTRPLGSAQQEQLWHALLEQAPARRAPSPSGAAPTQAYMNRMMRQMERQTTLNQRLGQRLTWLEAHLAILGQADLGNPDGSETLPEELLYVFLDAAGANVGAGFLLGPDGELALYAHLGVSGGSLAQLTAQFGQPDFFRSILERGEPVVLTPSDDLEGLPAELRGFGDSRYLLITPILHQREPLGLMLLGFSDEDAAADWISFIRVAGAHIAQAVRIARATSLLRESEARFRALVERLPAITFQAHVETRQPTYVSPQIETLLGFTPEEWLADPALWLNQTHPDDRAQVAAMLQRFRANGEQASYESRILAKDGHVVWFQTELRLVRDEDGQPPNIQGLALDITDRKGAEEQIARHLHRLEGLRAIDTAILGSFDQGLTLSILLTHVTALLGVDAAQIQLLSPHEPVLESAARRGFRSGGTQQIRLRLGEGLAGKAALERQMVRVGDMMDGSVVLRYPDVVAAEGFVAYFGHPLVVRGQLKGVLEIFHRSPLHPDREWVDFLGTLAGQAAIAVDNASLLADLQQRNVELGLAYDGTIEGWAHALELRDLETAGHSQRVPEMTVRLGRLAGLGEAELAAVRRGALLHDIGKMGIPDNILLKPGPLTPEEWEIMRRHPAIAHEWLQPIAHLRPALDIPYCHHEKWDGSGYPRGLRGEQIPLGARLFAIADVWDALGHARPYKEAWPIEQALDYMREQAGQHFDPALVELFLGSDLAV